MEQFQCCVVRITVGLCYVGYFLITNWHESALHVLHQQAFPVELNCKYVQYVFI